MPSERLCHLLSRCSIFAEFTIQIPGWQSCFKSTFNATIFWAKYYTCYLISGVVPNLSEKTNSQPSQYFSFQIRLIKKYLICDRSDKTIISMTSFYSYIDFLRWSKVGYGFLWGQLQLTLVTSVFVKKLKAFLGSKIITKILMISSKSSLHCLFLKLLKITLQSYLCKEYQLMCISFAFGQHFNRKYVVEANLMTTGP